MHPLELDIEVASVHSWFDRHYGRKHVWYLYNLIAFLRLWI